MNVEVSLALGQQLEHLVVDVLLRQVEFVHKLDEFGEGYQVVDRPFPKVVIQQIHQRLIRQPIVQLLDPLSQTLLARPQKHIVLQTRIDVKQPEKLLIPLEVGPCEIDSLLLQEEVLPLSDFVKVNQFV